MKPVLEPDHLQVQEINYELENTKPLFNDNHLLTVHILYKLQIITETLKIKKVQLPKPTQWYTEA